MILLSSAIALWSLVANAANPVYAPLWLYQGAWRVTRTNLAPGAKPDELVNQCALLGKYFACGQSVNGQPTGLLIFVPAAQPEHYYTQTVNPDGRGAGRGELQISGNQWTFSHTWDQGGKTTYYRTINTFAGKDRIHFEQAESPDGKDYKTTASGDEVHVAPTRSKSREP